MLKTFIYRLLCGIFLGMSALAPGFSGSVVAISMGFYRDLVKIVSNPLREIPRNMDLFAPIAVGVVLSVVLFVFGFRFLVESYLRAIYLLFAGLIAGSVPMIVKQIREQPFNKQYLIGGGFAFALSLTLILVGQGSGSMAADSAGEINLLLLGASGFMLGAILLVPGMSISAILIMLGVYGQLMYLAENFFRGEFSYFLPLLILALSALFGLVLMSRGIKAMLERFPGFSNTCILGFMTGTLLGILVESGNVYDPGFTWLQGILALLLGLGLSLVFMLKDEKA